MPAHVQNIENRKGQESQQVRLFNFVAAALLQSEDVNVRLTRPDQINVSIANRALHCTSTDHAASLSMHSGNNGANRTDHFEMSSDNKRAFTGSGRASVLPRFPCSNRAFEDDESGEKDGVEPPLVLDWAASCEVRWHALRISAQTAHLRLVPFASPCWSLCDRRCPSASARRCH